MAECFLCKTALEPANDAEIESVDLCIDCCEKLDVVIKDYLSSSPGGYELLLDVVADDLSNPEGRLRGLIKDIIRETTSGS